MSLVNGSAQILMNSAECWIIKWDGWEIVLNFNLHVLLSLLKDLQIQHSTEDQAFHGCHKHCLSSILKLKLSHLQAEAGGFFRDCQCWNPPECYGAVSERMFLADPWRPWNEIKKKEKKKFRVKQLFHCFYLLRTCLDVWHFHPQSS